MEYDYADLCFDVIPVGSDRRYRVCAAEDGWAVWVQAYRDDRPLDFVTRSTVNDFDALDVGFNAVLATELSGLSLTAAWRDALDDFVVEYDEP